MEIDSAEIQSEPSLSLPVGATSKDYYKMAFVAMVSGTAQTLPREVLKIVLAQLPHNFLITSSDPVCQRWHQVIQESAFLPWKNLYHSYKLAPTSPSSSLLLSQSGGDGGDDGGDSDSSSDDDDSHGDDEDEDDISGGGDDFQDGDNSGGGGAGGVLTAKQVVNRLCDQHSITNLSNCLVNIIRAVGESHTSPKRNSPTLLKCHRLYELAQDTLANLKPSLLPQPHSIWHLATTIVLLSHNVWDVHSLISLMLQPGSLFIPCMVVEGFYSIALFLLHSTTSDLINLPTRYHYQVFYALYLYENDWGASPEEGVQVNQEAPASQQFDNQKPNTLEQLRIITHPLQPGNVVKIIAFAGTGKTTTLWRLCKRWPDRHFLLITFNKSVQEHCEKNFPDNTEVRTFHSLAYNHNSNGEQFKAIWKFAMSIYATNLLRCLPDREDAGDSFRRVALVKNTLETFFNLADEDLELQHVPKTYEHKKIRETLDDDFRRRVILADAEEFWNDMKQCSADQTLPMTQNGLLKLWQLSHPQLEGYDVVLVDDGQDMNPAMLDVFLRQQCAKVVVGDPYQQIYSFRDAVNTLESIPSTHTFHLTQSFRFGPEVSYVANCVLETFNKTQDHTLVGGHKKDSFTAAGNDMEALCPSSRRRLAYVGRSNVEVYKKALEVCQQEENNSKTMAFAGGLRAFGLDRVMAIYNLAHPTSESQSNIKDSLIKEFKNFKKLQLYADRLNDMDLRNKIKMYEFSNQETPQHIQLLNERCGAKMDKPQITFSTIHKAKGMEWDHVVLLEDSWHKDSLSEIVDPITQCELTRDEINILYVSVTRAKTLLTLNSPMLKILQLSKERMEVLVAGGEVGEDCECVQCEAPVERNQPLVTKVAGMEVTGRGNLRGGYLCHQCSTQPSRFESPGRSISHSQTLVDALQPPKDYSRSARLQLMCGQLSEDQMLTSSSS